MVARELQEVGRSGEQALNRIRDAAQPASAQLEALNAVVGGVKKAFALVGAIAAGNQLFDSIHRAVSQTAELGDLAASIGVNVERLQELRYAAEQSGASAELLDTAIRTRRSTPQKHFSDDENGGFASTAAQLTGASMSSGAQQNRHLQSDKMLLRGAS